MIEGKVEDEDIYGAIFIIFDLKITQKFDSIYSVYMLILDIRICYY